VRIEPAQRLAGALSVPGDKSISHRAVLVAAICHGQTTIRGFGRSSDTESTIAAVRALGVGVDDVDVDTVRVRGVGLRGLRAPAGPIECGNAGTLARLLSGILAGQTGKEFELVGDASLSARPMGRIAEPLGRMGAHVDTTAGTLPLVIRGRRLHGIAYELPVASAQVKSCILLAGLFAEGDTTVIEPAPTRDHTESLLALAGAAVDNSEGRVTVRSADRLHLGEVQVPGDFSSAAPFVVAAALLPGSEVLIRGVNLNPRRTGLLAILERMGARVEIRDSREVCGEPAGDLLVAHAQLVAVEVGADEVPATIDELPLFALAAAGATGTSVLSGASELRAKESDRIETVVTGLRGLGVEIEGTEDGFRALGRPGRIVGGAMESQGDHRIAMLAAVAGIVSSEGVVLADADATAVSFPGFFQALESLAAR
jgi:3-phosphoshikimate 1-carboxyvinyltransferase